MVRKNKGSKTAKVPFLRILCILLPSVLFFSYQPLIPLGETNSTHLELSLPFIWLAVITIFTIPLLPQIFKSTPKKLLLALAIIPCYTIISLIWSTNRLRTFLSAGILLCIAATVLALIYLCKTAFDFKKKAINLFLATSVIVSVFAWLQCILDVAGVSRDFTLLCEGCTYQAFGFPHPNAFAIEPQFFGNLLLAPVFLCYYSLLYHKNSNKSKKLLWPTAIFLTTTLFFTFSRGAIYAFLLSITLLIIYHLCKKHTKYLTFIPVILYSAIFSLLCQGLFAQISPTTDTFTSGIAKSINHLSLGKIDLKEETKEDNVIIEKNENIVEPKFDGYVEESTEVRLTLTEMALKTWSSSPQTVLLGTALGGAGTVLYQNYPELGTAQQIVQNEYASLLLEFGLTGLAAIIAVAILIITSVKIKDKAQKSWLLALLFAYGLTLLFFSGLPNALHIYLLPVFAVLFSKHQFLVHRVVQDHNH